MSNDPLLDVSNVEKTFYVGFLRRKIPAVRGVSFAIESGEIFGVVGPNGAGKSTTIKMITGLVTPDAGTIRLFGHDVGHVDIRSRLGYVPENPSLYEHLKARELMVFYGGLLGLSRTQSLERAEELLELVGLDDALDRPVSKFSKGMKQRAGIAQALIGDPEFVVLDEPQSGLDPIGRREIRDLIVELRRRGKTILFCSHILPDIEDVCDRVALLHEGQVVETGFIHELLDQKILRYEIFAKNWSDDLTERLDDVIEDIFDVGELHRVELSGSIDLDATLQLLSESGVQIESLKPQKEHLEDIFVRDTDDQARDGSVGSVASADE